jgi:hypothetical protein
MKLSRPALPILIGLTLLLAPSATALPGDPCEPDCGGGGANARPSVSVSVDSPTRPRGQTFTFQATAEDPDGDALNYAWDIDGDGYDDGSGVSKSVSYAAIGSKTVSVRVDDGDLAATASRTVQVVNREPSVTWSKTPSSPVSGENVTFTALGSDPDGDAMTYAWDLDNNGTYEAAGQIVSRTFATPGSHPISVRVTDALSMQAFSAPSNVVIGNRGPTASFTTFPASPLVGEVVSFDSTPSSDPDGTVASRAWDLDNDGEFDDGAGVSASRNYLFPGSYTVALRVTDDYGDPATTQKTFTVAPVPGTGGTETGTGTGTGTGPGGGTSADTTSPTWSFTAAAQRAVKTKRLAFSVRPNESCKLVVVAKLGRKGLGTLSKQLAGGQSVTQNLRLGKKALRALRSALAKKAAVKVTIAMTCIDAAGNKGTAKRTLRVRR